MMKFVKSGQIETGTVATALPNVQNMNLEWPPNQEKIRQKQKLFESQTLQNKTHPKLAVN